MNQVELGTILHMEKGKKPQKQSKEIEDGFLPYVDIKAFEKGIIDSYASPEKCVLCDDGDLLIVCDGSRSGLTGGAIKGVVGSTLSKISADGLTREYLRYFIQSKYTLLNTQKKGTGTPHLNAQILKQSKLIIPSLPEQERIVARIEELFSELDKAVETLKTTKQQLAVYRQAVLKEAFSCADTFEPFGSIMTSRLGKMLDKEKNVGLPEQYIRNINVRWFSFDLSDLLKMRIETKEIEKYSIKYGDLIICEGGEPGRCAVWDRNDSIFYQKALHRVRFKNGENPKLYMYYLWFISQTGELEKYFTGTGIKHLTGQSLLKVPVPIISISKQNTVVLKIESQLSVCNQIEKMIEQSLQQAEAMRQSILKQAFEGRLV